MNILINVYIGLSILSIVLLFVSTIMGIRRLVLMSAVSILILMNNPHVSVITEPLGLGAPIIFMSIVALCLVISFRMDLLIIPSFE